MKNNYYIIKDTKNEIYVNAFIGLSDELAINSQENAIKQTVYIKNNTKNLAEKAQLISYLSNAANYTLLNKDGKELLNFEKLIKELDKNENITK